MKVKGADKFLKQLKNLQGNGAKRAMKKAARAAATVMARTLRKEAPVDEGLLRRSTTSKVSNGKRYGIAAIAGAAVDKLEADAKAENRPSNIDWLVNEGHVAPDGTVIPPEGYRERAQEASAEPAEAAYVEKLAAEIEKEAMKES